MKFKPNFVRNESGLLVSVCAIILSADEVRLINRNIKREKAGEVPAMEVFTTMTTNTKNELIAQLVNILSELIEANDSEQVSEIKSDAVEMLTVKECTEAVRGLSEHTVRKLIKQGKLPYLRTGDGVNGKMLINKADLLAYFNGQTANK